MAESSILDWMAATLPVPAGVNPSEVASDVIARFYGGTARGYGRFRYDDSAVVLGTGLVLWHDDRPQMGVHVSLPASALAQLSKLGDSVSDVYNWIVSQGGRFSRVDLAFDTEVVTVQWFYDRHLAGDVVSHITFERMIVGKRGELTVYYGRRSGDVYVRIYDKGAEQGGAVGQKTRIEFQLRGDRADQLMHLLYAGGDVGAVARGILDVRDKESDSNVSRREVYDEWVRVFGGAVGSLDVTYRGTSSCEDVEVYIREKMAPCLAAIMEFHGGDLNVLVDIVRSGRSRIRADLQADIALHKLVQVYQGGA